MIRTINSMINSRPTSSITVAAIIGQLFSLAAIPIVSRQYSPADVGYFSACLAIGFIAASVATARIDRAVTLPKDDRDAAIFATGGLLISITLIAIATCVYCTIVFFLDFSFVHLWWAIPCLTLAIAWGTILLQFSVRQRNYTVVCSRNILQPSVTALLQVMLGAWTASPVSLTAAASIGRIFGLVSPAKAIHTDLQPVRIDEFIDRLGNLICRYRRVLTLGTVAGLLNTASLQIAIPIVSVIFSGTDAGQFAMAQLVLGAPLVLVGTAVGQVFLGDFASDIRNGSGKPNLLFRRTSLWLCAGALAIGAVVALFARPLFPLILGDQWEHAGILAVAMVPLLVTRFVAAPLAQTLIVLERQGTQLALDALRLSGIFGTFFFCHFADLGISVAVFAYSAWSALCYLAQWTLCRHALNRHVEHEAVQGSRST